jgi:hypothetical protein
MLMVAGGEPARASGLLLGTDQHRSFWIRAVDREIQMLEIPGIIIPRRSGFWRLERAWATWPDSSDFGPSDEPKADSEEEWSIVRLGREASFPHRAGATIVTEAPTAAPCEETDLRPACIDPNWIAYERTTTYECGAHPDGDLEWRVAPLDDWQSGLRRASELLGADGLRALRDSLAGATDRYERQWGDQNCGEPSWDGRNWVIARDRGRWVARGWAVTHRLCGYGFEFTSEAALPDSLVTAGGHTLPWDVIVRRVPAAYDAMESPAGDLVVILTPDEVLAYRIEGGRLIDPPTRRPFGIGPHPSARPTETAVLVEWALGRNVDRWARTLTRAAAP